MPKGVEHDAAPPAQAITSGVELPLMPKGVEHGKERGASWETTIVELPLMPKGVEHTLAGGAPIWVSSGATSDAERR